MLSNETIPKSPAFIGIEILQLKGVQIVCPFLTPLNYNISVPIKAGDFGVVSFDNIPSELSYDISHSHEEVLGPPGGPQGP